MIQGFRHKGLQRLFEIGQTKGIRADQIEKVENILGVLNLAVQPEDMNLPGFRLHPLKGGLKGFWSVPYGRTGASSSDSKKAMHTMLI
jgi:toxin HigB-1